VRLFKIDPRGRLLAAPSFNLMIALSCALVTEQKQEEPGAGCGCKRTSNRRKQHRKQHKEAVRAAHLDDSHEYNVFDRREVCAV